MKKEELIFSIKKFLLVKIIIKESIISSEKYRHIEADELIVVDHTYYY